MYTEVSQIQQSSNGDKQHMSGVATYSALSKRIDDDKHNQAMITHDGNSWA